MKKMSSPHRRFSQWGWLGMIPIWVLLLACATPRPPDSIVVPTPFSSASKSVLILPFSFSPAIATQVNQKAVQNFGEAIAFDIQSNLEKTGLPRPLVIYPGEEVLGDLLIQGRITRVSGGNRWHRIFFELFGFGATEVKVTGEVIDLYSSTPVLGFGLSRGSGFTWRENEAAVREDLRQIAEEVSRALILQNSLNHQGGQ